MMAAQGEGDENGDKKVMAEQVMVMKILLKMVMKMLVKVTPNTQVMAEQGEETSLLSGCRALMRAITKVVIMLMRRDSKMLRD